MLYGRKSNSNKEDMRAPNQAVRIRDEMYRVTVTVFDDGTMLTMLKMCTSRPECRNNAAVTSPPVSRVAGEERVNETGRR